jgi:hypothetical protein
MLRDPTQPTEKSTITLPLEPIEGDQGANKGILKDFLKVDSRAQLELRPTLDSRTKASMESLNEHIECGPIASFRFVDEDLCGFGICHEHLHLIPSSLLVDAMGRRISGRILPVNPFLIVCYFAAAS